MTRKLLTRLMISIVLRLANICLSWKLRKSVPLPVQRQKTKVQSVGRRPKWTVKVPLRSRVAKEEVITRTAKLASFQQKAHSKRAKTEPRRLAKSVDF